ncbi:MULTISPECIES: DUF998 domain-containing protein [Breznakia]|uniref:Uncharacterized protein DUF998 n=1 Tax=Breznakia blatticola TaxID=1754012 RepID=A0A4R7ZS33_9FIRM|nr:MULTISPECIES: DUF998 domain-containing protein [Breznakia]MDH6367477.1 putative membrane protein [Breznakia sp. PH1-1]MDH6404550.1 putative membrane protein [Breznakia sp. PF1-11]MDH6412259.1 putative membrane protein [Breznakia sp. PFB1-11]MDH6414644.1 putative membrane protein [Breznakia sp. PFB1-14]MDH6417015.1 putative membrane protein [Breznakia sp. PFB1-4]
MKRRRIQYFGLMGIVSFIAYVMTITCSTFAYPNYNWMSQAVSDLFALDSPALGLWNQLTIVYMASGIVSITLVYVYIENKLNQWIQLGIGLFTLMNWISCIGYQLFPLSQKGYAGTFTDFMHTYVVTLLVVLLSITSLICIIIGGYKDKTYINLSRWAATSLLFMTFGAIGVGIVPSEFFGIPERFSVLSATFFNAVLGYYLYRGFQFPTKKQRVL